MRKQLTRFCLAMTLAGAVLTAGCDRDGAGRSADGGVPAPIRPPSSQSDGSQRVEFKPTPTAVTASTPAAATVRPPSFLTIDGKQVLFPPSKLAILKQTPGDFRVRLCTDDPPTAIDPGYAGNSFLFDMKLGIDSADHLRTARWIGTGNDFDSDAGIFLDGFRNPYRPQDVRMTFSGEPDDLSVYVDGTFSHNDPHDPFGPPQTVKVHGTVNVPAPKK